MDKASDLRREEAEKPMAMTDQKPAMPGYGVLPVNESPCDDSGRSTQGKEQKLRPTIALENLAHRLMAQSIDRNAESRRLADTAHGLIALREALPVHLSREAEYGLQELLTAFTRTLY